MRKVEELQDQIRKLSPEEFADLRNWFDKQSLGEAKWPNEAEDRLAAYRSGDLAGVDAEQVFDELGKAALS